MGTPLFLRSRKCIMRWNTQNLSFFIKTVQFDFQFITDTVITLKNNSKYYFHVLQAYLSAKSTPQICILTFQIVVPF